MRTLLLILLLAVSAHAQDWKLIKEMSGDIPNHNGLTVEVYAAEIARGDDKVKLLMKIEYPWGSPRFEGATYPQGFDVTSIARILTKVEFNCETLEVKPIKGSTEIYTVSGQKHKSREAPFNIKESHIFSQYFCERGMRATIAPTLKPK
jgi:hypothetical protein